MQTAAFALLPESTSPARGTTAKRIPRFFWRLNFNPRPPHGGRRVAVGAVVAKVAKFQSTSPARGTTAKPYNFSGHCNTFCITFYQSDHQIRFYFEFISDFFAFFKCEPMLVLQTTPTSHYYKIRFPLGSYDSFFPYCSIFEEYFFPRL